MEKQFLFIAKGNSMNTGKSDAIPNNSMIIGREVNENEWQNKPSLFIAKPCILTLKSGFILITTIKKLNKKAGLVTCHPLNMQYPDYDIAMSKISKFYMVESVTRDHNVKVSHDRTLLVK
jgi:hypothetical protein